ncbi:MAG: hypothetical protein ACEQSL_03765 [Sediminibacterium sp.]
MKTTHNELINVLMPTFRELADMQSKGLVIIPHTLIGAISKNMSKLTNIYVDYNNAKRKLVKHHVKHDNKNQPITLVENGKVKGYDFNDEAAEQEFRTSMNEFLDSEFEFTGFKMNEQDVMRVDNFPVSVLSTLQQFDMLTPLHEPILMNPIMGKA